GRGKGRGPRPPPAPRPAAHRRSPGTAPRSRRSRRCLPSSRALRSATAGGRGAGAVVAVGQLGAARGPDHAALDEGAHVLVLEHLDPVAGGGHEDAAFAHWRVQTAGEVTSRCHGSHSRTFCVVVASTSM